MIPHDPFHQLHDLDRSSPEFHEQLSNFFCGEAYRRVFSDLGGEDLAWLVEYLDSVIVGISNHATPMFQESLHELGKICGAKEVLPKSCTLSESLLGFVYEGTFNGSKVRVRRVKTHPGGDPRKVKEAFHQVAAISKHLAHPNIVPLLGATIDPLELISDWMPGGDLTRYISNHADADIPSLLSDVAEGLHYLHSRDVIHGDLKCSNILVDATGRARITDFGLAAVTRDPDSVWSVSTEHDQNARWIAPEILDNRWSYSKESDVFSFAGVTIEVFTGTAPFSDMAPHAARLAVMSGERPPRPAHLTLTDGIWSLIQRCWDQEPLLRPRPLRISSGFGVPAWKRMVELPLASDGQISLITDIFSDRDEIEAAERLDGDDAQCFVDVIDKTLDRLGALLQQKCLSVLCKICGRQALLPRSLQIPLCYDQSVDPLYSGGFADVWKGEHQGTDVAVKVLRVASDEIRSARSIFCKEVMMWRGLSHPNMLPLLGVTMTSNRFALISEWMYHGNINDFVTMHGSVNRLELLEDVARGLTYMHDQAMIHGDLKGVNILVDRNRHARLADFGLPTFVSDPTNPTASISIGDTMRWTSPERLHPRLFGFEDSRPTKESDRYALGMVILEVLSGQPPFADHNVIDVMRWVIDGGHPERPNEAWFTNDLWGTLAQCWSFRPERRPTGGALLECLERVSLAITINSQRRLITRSFSQNELPFLLEAAFWNKGPMDTARSFLGGNSQVIIDVLDEMLDTLVSPLRQKCLSVLCKICGSQALLPRSLQIPLCYDPSDVPLYSGGFADVWRGEHQRTEVAVKVLRVVSGNLDKIRNRFCKEVMTWRSLSHPNVLPLLGVMMTSKRFAMISEWMDHGNINEFIEVHRGVNRFELLQDVARGLIYMHNQAMIHGDLKGVNILIDRNCHACLADFGLLTFVLDPTNLTASISATNFGGTTRWMSPELLSPQSFGFKDSRPTKESDCYAFGMVILEVLCGQVPFADDSTFIIMQKVMGGEHPERPKEAWFTDDLWGTLEECWSPQPERRPTIGAVLDCLERVSLAITIDSQQCLVARLFSQKELLLPLEAVFCHREPMDVVQSLQGGNHQVFIDILDEALGSLSLPSGIRKECLQSLCEICGRHAIFPTSLRVELDDVQTDGVLYQGGSANVLKHSYQGREVAVKTLRISTSTDLQRITRRFCKEFALWNALRHPGILPLIGVIMSENEFSMVSEWMPNGNINRFVKEHQDANRFELLSDVARGLIYMHDQGMIHGDLKGGNILVDQTCHARIADFGLTILSDSTVPNLCTQGGTVRWMSPELFDSELQDRCPTKYSDCYALGMVVYEVLSLHIPFYQYRNPVIPGKVVQGDRPKKPEGGDGVFTDDVWKVLERCWAPEPRDRPRIEDVLRYLEKCSTSWVPPPHQNTTASTDASWDPSPSQTASFRSTTELGRRYFAGVANKRYPPPGAGSSLPMRDLAEEAIRSMATEPIDPSSQNNRSTFPELTTQPVGEEDKSGVGRTIHQKNQQPRMKFGVATADRTISASASLTKVANWDGESQDLDQILTSAFGAEDYLDCIKNLQARDIDPLSYINSLDKIIDNLPLGSDLRRRCIRALRKTCGSYGLLPTSYTITFPLSRPGQRSFASGTFSDVWRLTHATDPKRIFAAKSLRVYEQDPAEKINKIFCKEVVVQKRAVHPNVLPLEGVAPKPFDFCLVTPWMEHGGMPKFVANYPGVNRLDLLIGVTCGLDYLHVNEIVHGDLKSTNILIDAGGNPRIFDFGLCSITENINSVNASTPHSGCTVRYCAPELFDVGVVARVEKKKATYKGDVYSLSMVIVELVTGKIPFPDSTDFEIPVIISKGKRPRRPRSFDPPGITPGVWAVAERCWHEKPERRPEVKAVLQNLENIANPGHEQTPSTLKQIWRGIVN